MTNLHPARASDVARPRPELAPAGAPPGRGPAPLEPRAAPTRAPAGARAGVEQPPAGAPAPPELAPLEAPAIAGWRPRRLRMLDLFSGSGAASRAAAVRGWEVLRVDNGAGTAADVRADLTEWSAPPGPWDLLWASPPCTQLSTANASTRDIEAGLVCVRAALRLVDDVRPRWWVLENVHGATRAIGDLIGPPVARYGSFYLWGVFPPFDASVPRSKTKLSGRRRAERRAAIPWAISDGLIRACEALAAELERGELGGGPAAAGGARGGSPGLERSRTGAGADAGGGQVGDGRALERGELGPRPGAVGQDT